MATRGARTASATVVATGAGPGTVTLRRCLNRSCKKSVVMGATPVQFINGPQSVRLATKALRPGTYRWTATLGLSTATARMVVRAASRPVPVTG